MSENSVRFSTDLFKQGAGLAGQWLLDQAGKKSAQLGFSYIAKEDSPNTIGELRAAFRVSQKTGDPLPVSSKNDTTPYPDDEHVYAQRFYHDCTHMLTGLSFDLKDEIQVSRIHLSDMQMSGLKVQSMEYQILQADLVGQVYCQGLSHKFVSDQTLFIREACQHGLTEAVCRELQRHI